MKRVEIDSYKAEVFIAGDLEQTVELAQVFCDRMGLCVSVSPTTYVFTGGLEHGAKLTLINYGRFPTASSDILNKAESLANFLLENTHQLSVSVVCSDRTIWISHRVSDE